MLNLDKTKSIDFSCTNQPVSDDTVDAHDEDNISVKFLGLVIDHNLNWKEHVRYLCPKLSSACYALKQLSPITDTETLITVYNSYFQSYLSYGIIFWGNSTDCSKVFKIQKRALRIINHSSNYCSCRPLFAKFRILPLFSLYIYELLRFCKRNADKFTKNNCFHTYDTRHRSALRTPKHR